MTAPNNVAEHGGHVEKQGPRVGDTRQPDLRDWTLGVAGFGLMGSGIATSFAAAGASVIVWDIDTDSLDAGRRRVSSFLGESVRRGKIDSGVRDEVVERTEVTTDVAEFSRCDVVVEAIVERHDMKVDLLRQVDGVVRPDAVIATNTSALSVTALAASLRDPGRIAGMHFFNPAPLMKLVEIVRALQTRDATLERLLAVARGCGKNPIVVKDRPGFVVNRLLMPFLNDVIQAYDDGLASAEDIDAACTLGLGHPLGPLELVDLIGLDTHAHATTAAWTATRRPEFAVPPLLARMVEAGWHGDKSTGGFRRNASRIEGRTE